MLVACFVNMCLTTPASLFAFPMLLVREPSLDRYGHGTPALGTDLASWGPPRSSRGHPTAKMGPKKGNRFRVRATVCAGSFADALAPGSPFVRCATLARVGFASPPCVDISIVNSKRQESSACAELTVDCVRALRLVRHEVLCLETTTTVTSARGGRLLQSVYEAADDVGYVPHLMCLDPLRLGGCQSRCRAYIVFVRRDVYTRRGPFAPPSSYAICGAPTPMRMMLDPVSSLPPAVNDGIMWNVVDRAQQPGYTGPILCASAIHTCRSQVLMLLH